MQRPKVIAFYLPQYYPTKHNDLWWGKGFTEWTNVAKAKKLFLGHYQPKVPTELGFYDLRLPQVRKLQAELATEAGVYGFCYYHYWFSEGHEELEIPFNEVVASGSPDFPFCLCWANESWHAKFWNKDGTSKNKLLIEQQYLGEKDNESHFYSLLKAFSDKRYIKVEGRLLFMIYKPLDFENFESFKNQWNQLAKQNGLPSFYFVGQTFTTKHIPVIRSIGFDAVNHCHRLDDPSQYHPFLEKVKLKLLDNLRKIVKYPRVIQYKNAIKYSVRDEDFQNDVFPTMMPNWDHTPRSGAGGVVLHNSTPELFSTHVRMLLESVKEKNTEHQIVFLKSWNEWGEGNYMEPDIKYGRRYIRALKSTLEEFCKNEL